MPDHNFVEKVRAAFVPLGCEIRWVEHVNDFKQKSIDELLVEAHRRKEDAVSERLKQRFVTAERIADGKTSAEAQYNALQLAHYLNDAILASSFKDFAGLLAKTIEKCFFYHQVTYGSERKIITPLLTLMFEDSIFPFLCVRGRIYCITYVYSTVS